MMQRAQRLVGQTISLHRSGPHLHGQGREQGGTRPHNVYTLCRVRRASVTHGYVAPTSLPFKAFLYDSRQDQWNQRPRWCTPSLPTPHPLLCCISLSLSLSLSISPSPHLSVSLLLQTRKYLNVFLSLSVSLSLIIFLCLSVSLSLSVCLSVSQSTNSLTLSLCLSLLQHHSICSLN